MRGQMGRSLRRLGDGWWQSALGRPEACSLPAPGKEKECGGQSSAHTEQQEAARAESRPQGGRGCGARGADTLGGRGALHPFTSVTPISSTEQVSGKCWGPWGPSGSVGATQLASSAGGLGTLTELLERRRGKGLFPGASLMAREGGVTNGVAPVCKQGRILESRCQRSC